MRSSLRELLEHVLASDLLQSDLVRVAEQGATSEQLKSAPQLPSQLRELLLWRNGLDLDVVRLHGIGTVGRRVERVQFDGTESVLFASDPAGFQYSFKEDGSVNCYDHDGGKVKVVAASVDDFLRGYVFGSRACEFGGDEWASEVAAAVGER